MRRCDVEAWEIARLERFSLTCRPWFMLVTDMLF